MAYTPVTFVDGVTPLNAANLNKLEDGVEAAHTGLDAKVDAGTFGGTTLAGAMAQVTSNYKNVSAFTMSDSGVVTALCAWMDGLGPGSGNQALRFVLYADSGGAPAALLAQSDEIMVVGGSALAHYRAPVIGGPTISPGTYWLGFIGGPAEGVARLSYEFIPSSQLYDADIYNDGPSNPFGTADGVGSYQSQVYAQYIPVTGGGGGADLSYDGDWAAGTYQDGDVVVKDGIAYLCVGGPTTVAPDVTPWGGAVANRPAGELAYAEYAGGVITVTPSTDATGQTILTLPAITSDGVTPVIVEFHCPRATPASVAGGLVVVSLWEGATQIGRIAVAGSPAANVAIVPMHGHYRFTPAAGTHTYVFKAHQGGGNATLQGDAGGAVAGSNHVPIHGRVQQANPVFIAPAGPTVCTYGLALPSSPADGQEHVLVDSLTAPTYQWRFRYNAGSSSAYKWEFVGGAPLRVASAASQSISSTSPVSFSPAVSATLARAGEYRVTISAQIDATGGSNNGHSQLRIGGGADAAYLSLRSAGTNQPNAGYRTVPVTVTAGQTVEYRASVEAATAVNFNWAALEIVPVRVA